MNTIPVLRPEEALRRLASARQPYHGDYFAMYSSALGGIVTDPSLMVVPVDDHLVHRGDGVFETLKCTGGNGYCFDLHLQRLLFSAGRIGLALPCTKGDLLDILVQTIRAGGRGDCLVRILLSRGPGGMGVNPYECPAPGLYILAYALRPPFMQTHPGGASARISRIPLKPGFFANIKCCNYLNNVLMKREAVDTGVDFTLALDERGFLAEGATENAGIVTQDRRLLVPRPERILSGTTVRRILDLLSPLVAQGLLAGAAESDISLAELRAAREILIFGTSPDVAAVVDLDGSPVGPGMPGPVCAALAPLIAEDMRKNTAVLTPIFLSTGA